MRIIKIFEEEHEENEDEKKNQHPENGIFLRIKTHEMEP